jgi:antitoxin (DNA-binding transcriptional repressor) of toxin-antitoxin stability system
MATKITATSLSHDLSDVLNRVLYREESFLIERSGKAVARLEPVGRRLGVTLREVIDRIGDLEVPEGFAEAAEEFRAAQGDLEAPDWLS